MGQSGAALTLISAPVLALLVGLPVPAVLPMHGFRARYAKHGCRCSACRHAHAVYEHERRRKASAGVAGFIQLRR